MHYEPLEVLVNEVAKVSKVVRKGTIYELTEVVPNVVCADVCNKNSRSSLCTESLLNLIFKVI